MEIITLIGFLAAILTTISFLPQTIKTIKTRCVKDLSLGMYGLLTTGVFLWFLYGVLIKDLPIAIANGIALIFSSTILFLIIKYK